MGIGLSKKNKLIFAVIIIGLIFIGRLFFLQIIDQEYKITADNNALRYQVSYPARGLILDRYGNILAGNETAYDIMITPYEVKEFDTTEICNIFDISIQDIRSRLETINKNRRQIGYQQVVLVKQASYRQYSVFAEKAHKFPGFSSIPRTKRTYPFNAGANLLGYISEVDPDFIRNNPKYRPGDYVGKTGIELSYEDVLGGEKGYHIYLRDVKNKIVSSYKDGEYDKEAIPGKSILSSIDASLQQYGELLMKNKIGSIVAIEPSTGEILTLVSSPGIDINQLASINLHYNQIVSDPLKPMFNRAVMSPYPPGSVFKVVNALIALQEGLLQENTRYSCSGGYHVGRTVGCHPHPSPIDLPQSIMMSCNTYYCIAFRNIIDNPKYKNVAEGFNRWREMVESFGFGNKLGSDFPSELGGNLPTTNTYDRIHGKGRWRSLSIISLAIGQGELGTTPLHLANLAATIANRGHYYTPHIVKGSPDTLIKQDFAIRHNTMVDPKHFEPIIEGMYRAVNSPPGSGATAWRVAVPGLDICGKTGTSQNPHGKDHSVFICFAPRDNPKIAVAAYLENAGFGATWAAPIATLIVEKYLTEQITRKYLEEHIINSNLIPISKRR